MARQYPDDVYLEAKRQFIEDGRSALAISKHFGGKPTSQTIHNWSREPDASGKTWEDLRQERIDERYEEITPQALADWIMGAMFDLKRNGGDHTKTADALAKYAKTLRQIVDPIYQMSMTYEVLRRFTEFILSQYPEMRTPAFVQAVRDFKNDQRKRLLREPG